MGLGCKLFGHKWNGCKCERCSATRDEQHAWEQGRCIRCGGYCGRHVWTADGLCVERCSICGATREKHEYQGCRCTQCGATRDSGHILNGCKCKICERVIGGPGNKNHRWNYCTCVECGKKRYADYGTHCDYHRIEGTNTEKCSVCGHTNRIHEARDAFTDDGSIHNH